MSDALTTIPLQVPTSTVKNAAALQIVLNGSPFLAEYVIPHHPLPLQVEWVSAGAQTDYLFIPAPGAGIRTAITMLSAVLSADATVNVRVRIGFGATTIPLESGSTANVPLNHQLTPGGGIVLGNGSGIIAIGAANTPLRITMTVATGGKVVVGATYYQPQLA